MKCGLCKKKIDKKESYVKVTDYKEGEFYMEGFYHNKCYNDRIKNAENMKTKALMGVAMGMFGRANRLLDKAEVQYG